MSKSALHRSRSNFPESRQLAYLRRQRGFTLLEVLVVVVIISVIVGFAVLAIDTGPEEQRREGNRLAALLQLAAEEAVMNGREYRVVLRRHGYAFEQLREGKWQGAEGELLRPRQLAAGLELELALEGQPVALAGDDAPERETVALFLLSSGEITPFELTLTGEAGGLVAIRSDGSAIESRSGNFESDYP